MRKLGGALACSAAGVAGPVGLYRNLGETRRETDGQ